MARTNERTKKQCNGYLLRFLLKTKQLKLWKHTKENAH